MQLTHSADTHTHTAHAYSLLLTPTLTYTVKGSLFKVAAAIYVLNYSLYETCHRWFPVYLHLTDHLWY